MRSFHWKGLVSVWAGLDEPEEGIDLLKDLCAVNSYDADFQELAAMDDWSLRTVRRLLEQVSYSASFIDGAVAVASKMSLRRARYVLCQFDFRYDPRKVKRKVADDPVFIGAFAWNHKDDDPIAKYGSDYS